MIEFIHLPPELVNFIGSESRDFACKNGPDRYVPDTLYITGIPHVFEIEQVCRKRIKENDPTPVIT